MVGGTVIEVCDVPGKPDVLFVDCADMPKGRRKPDTCAVLLQRCAESEAIKLGDCVWWQGRYAYWTPVKNRVCAKEAKRRHLTGGLDYDIKIERIGYSGVEHPSRQASQ